jgi:hypothetical protein
LTTDKTLLEVMDWRRQLGAPVEPVMLPAGEEDDAEAEARAPKPELSDAGSGTVGAVLTGTPAKPVQAENVLPPASGIPPEGIKLGDVNARVQEAFDTGVAEQQREELWTLLLDAAGGNPQKATNLMRKTVMAYLKRPVETLEDLSVDELRTVAQAMVTR